MADVNIVEFKHAIDGPGLTSGGRDYVDRAMAETAIDMAILAERDACASKAREYAGHYPEGSDGRNTFILLAEWIEQR